MLTNSGFLPTCPDSLSPEKPRSASLDQLLKATQDLKLEPIITLATALAQLGVLDPREIERLAAEDPQLLRSRASELVGRLLMTPEDLHHALARTAGMVEVDAARFKLPDRAFDVQLLRKMRTHDLLFLGEADDTLFVATWYPTDEKMHNRLRSLTSRSVRMVWADRDAIAARLERMDPLAPLNAPEHDLLTAHQAFVRKAVNTAPAATHAVIVHNEDMQHLMSETARVLASGQAQTASDESEESSVSPSMVRMVMRLILDAQALHASDIHIETNPGEEFTRIRLRRDGDLELYQKIAPALRSAMVSRIKIMARLDISEHRRPQDGKINFSEFGGDCLELRVSIMPTHDGMEDVVMRLLASSKPVPLAKLGLQPRDAEAVARMSARSFGLILAAGPTGSGKTTTLHSMLAEINTEERKIWTAEDPIEITQPGLRQVQVHPKIDFTFAVAMRAFLRADPDVIMVGEMRDHETAATGIEASLTGHLVFSTLHTNSAPETITRLLDMDIDPFNFADALLGIMAQRLVRTLCKDCKEEYAPTQTEFAELMEMYGLEHWDTLGLRYSPDFKLYRPKGCPKCGGTGYKGRMGIHELLVATDEIKRKIQKREPIEELRKQAQKDGMTTLLQDGIQKVIKGVMDFKQVRAVCIK